MRAAVFTIAHNERHFFPLWLRYYSRHFSSEDIYVLDHDTTDGSLLGGGFTRIAVSNNVVFDHAWLRDTVQHHQRELLSRYDWVLFAEVDEIVAARPGKYAGIRDLITRSKAQYMRCQGWEVFHDSNTELPFDYAADVMSQRSFWLERPRFRKTLLSRVPLEWCLGFHESEPNTEPHPDLYLIHLHRLGYQLAWARLHERLDRPVSEPDKLAYPNHHNFNLNARPQFRKWYHSVASEVVPIPDDWRGVVI